MVTVRHLELMCGNARPPTKTGARKPVFKFCLDRFGSFEDIVNRKFCKFGLKRLFRPPRFTFWGILTPKHYFSSSRPPKGTTLAGNTSYEPSCVVIGPAVWPGRNAKNTQTKKQRVEPKLWQTGCSPRPPP